MSQVVPRNVIVVGGGIAGLTAAIYLARGGCRVTIFEKKPYLGGRAITHLRRGFRFNLGPRSVYRAGTAAQIYRELGVPIRGGSPSRKGTAVLNGECFKLPVSPLALVSTGLLTGKAKFEAASLLLRLRSLSTKPFAAMTIGEWLNGHVKDERLRQVMAALVRLTTYSGDETQSAVAALDQLKLVMRGGVIYVDEGWQKIVDGLHSHAVSAGVNFVTSSRVIAVEHDQSVRAVRLGGLEASRRNDTESITAVDIPEAVRGTRLPVETVVLAVDPATASDLLGDGFKHTWRQLKPVTVDCLDVALTRLPQPKRTLAIGLDAPLYLSVHSSYAQLTPRGGALVHVAKYRSQPGPASSADDYGDSPRANENSLADEQQLERMLDDLQPGWRNVIVHRRFLPAMTVAHALRTPGMEPPSPATPIRGLYVAGDWVRGDGILSDAALSSARAAARAILSSE